MTNISRRFTYKMATKINWHRYGTKNYAAITVCVLRARRRTDDDVAHTVCPCQVTVGCQTTLLKTDSVALQLQTISSKMRCRQNSSTASACCCCCCCCQCCSQDQQCQDQDRDQQHTHTHPYNGPLSGTTRMSRYQKGKTNLSFTEARDSEWQWHQVGHMQVCTSLQTDNHASTPPLSFLPAGCLSYRPTNSVKSLKARPRPANDT